MYNRYKLYQNLKTPKKNEKEYQINKNNRSENNVLLNYDLYGECISKTNNKNDSKENKIKGYKNMNNNYNDYEQKYSTFNNIEDLKKEENINQNLNKEPNYIKSNLGKPNYKNISNSTRNLFQKKIDFAFPKTNKIPNINNNNINNTINNSDKKNIDNIKINTKNINNIEDNLNIGELISQKNNDPSMNTVYISTNPNLNPTKKKLNIDNKYEKKKIAPSKPLRRTISESNIIILPKYLEIFNECNLFNSSLLILSNIFYVNNYIKNKSNENKLKECHKNNRPCLTTVLFNINKYFYYYIINNNIEDQFLSSLYNYYINWYSKVYFKEDNPNNIIINNANLESIIKNIYEKINSEFTKINLPIKKVLLKKENKVLNNFLLDFWKNNNSIIADCFLGIYQIESQCSECNKIEYEYESFPIISFKKFENISYNYANFYSCLNNFYSEKNKNDSCCKNCLQNTAKVKFYIYKCPKILTIILSDFDNYDFNIENKLDLKNYANYFPDNSEGIYNLISILCQNKNNNKYSTYFINIFNGLWYCYTDKKISGVNAMDINDIPLMLIYQISIKNEMISNYQPLKRENIYKLYFSEKESYKKLNSRKTYYKNEFEKEKNNNSKLNVKIKELERQLKEEKDNNLKEKNENEENLNEKIKELEKQLKEEKDKNLKEKKENEENLKKKLIQLENQIKKEKEKNLKEKNEYEENLEKKQKELEELSGKYNNLMNIINYNNDMKEKENNSLKKIIARYPFKLSKNEKMITVTFCSFDESIEYPLICKNADSFRNIEKLFYDKYPEYKTKIKKFYINGKIVNRKENLKENKISNGDKIVFE